MPARKKRVKTSAAQHSSKMRQISEKRASEINRAPKFKRIRITGGSGSGKSYLAAKIAEHTRYPVVHLDYVFYDFSKTTKFENKRDIKEAQKMIKKVFSKKRWIIEGSWMKHTKYTYDKADVLILLCTPFFKRMMNGFFRFLKRAFSGRYEGILSYLDLVWYNITHWKEWETTRVDRLTKEYGHKLHVFKSADEAYAWFMKKSR